MNTIKHSLVFLASFILLQSGVQAARINSENTSLAPDESYGRLPAIEKIVEYYDQDYQFHLAVPEAWNHVYAAVSAADEHALEPGYAIGFESPIVGAQDDFADYLMIEILPGAQTGAFDSDGSESDVVLVDGKVAVTDKVEISGFDINGKVIELMVFQAEIMELGYTVGIFAIGEKREAEVLADAFNLALKTFKIPQNPFEVI